MQLSAPKVINWWIALILGALGLIANLVTIPVLSSLAFWLVVVALVLLLAATSMEGL